MNPPSPLQLKLPATDEGVLHVVFRAKSDPEEIPTFKSAIDGRLSADGQIRKVIFDLSQIDPLMNAAGRLLDLACEIFRQWKIPAEARIPADIYELLHEIEPHRVPPPNAKPPLRVRGITVQIVEPLPAAFVPDEAEVALEGEGEAPTAVQEAETRTILCCRGKVRAINGSLITVSLFTDQDEIVGEFDRSQFSRPDLRIGMVFEYQARVNAPGVTTVSIDLLTPQYPTDEEMLDASKSLRVDFSKF